MNKLAEKFGEVQPLLKLTYGIVPIVAGLDKFTNLLTDWSQYLHPLLAANLPFGAHQFMMIVGVIEIIAGVLVLVNPRRGAYVVCAWLVLIALSLIASGKYLDVAVRDLVMAIGAYSLARISSSYSGSTFGFMNTKTEAQVQKA